MADAAEAAVAGGNFRFEYSARAVAEQEISVADDTRADYGRTVAAARAHRRGAVREFNLANGAQRFRPAGAIHRAGLDIDGRNNIVAGGDVGGHFLDQIGLAAAIPRMMMGIDDRTRWIDDFFLA